MGKFYNWLFGEPEQTREETDTTNVTPPVDDVLLKALLDGETITREKAMTLPAVSGAVDFISSCVACMPVKLYKYKKGKVEEVEDDTRVRCLNGDTGDTLDAYQMKKAMVEDYLLGKGGYCYIQRDRNDVTGLFYVEDRYITIWKTYEPIYKTYQIYVCGYDNHGNEKQAGTYRPWDFIKLLRNTKDGASGTGLVVEISKELETAYQTLLYQLGIVKSGGAKRGFLKAQRKLGQDEINTLKKAWGNLYGNNSENIVVLNNGLEFQEASASSVEMQLNESKRTLQDEINNLFHISGDFYETFKFAIYPIVKAFETALNRDLLLEKEKKNHFFEFDVKEIVRANLQERYAAYKVAKETGFMTLNEIRRAENMNYVEGLDVVNVGLGAVLYDTNEHKFFTPNTGETTAIGDDNSEGNPEDINIQKMLEGHELVEEYDESGNSADRFIEERFNPNHSAKDGRFTTGNGGGGGGVASGNAEKIKELEEQLAKTSRFGAGAEKRKELQKQINELKGTDDQKPVKEKPKAETPKAEGKQIDKNPVTPEKEAQFEIIQKSNAMTDDLHTGIRKPSDIKSATEAFVTSVSDDDDYLYPDFTKADGEKAVKTGKITVYSSKPIGDGGFVSPSKMMAQDYAGGGKVYSQEVGVDDVAWIDSNEGQFAKRK